MKKQLIKDYEESIANIENMLRIFDKLDNPHPKVLENMSTVKELLARTKEGLEKLKNS